MCGSRSAARAAEKKAQEVGMAHRQRQAEAEMVRRVNLNKKILRLLDPKELRRHREGLTTQYGPQMREAVINISKGGFYETPYQEFKKLAKGKTPIYYDPDKDITSGGLN